MSTYSDLKEAVTSELEERILRLLQKRVGSGNAIKKSEALRYLPGVNERAFRMAVANLRKSGMLIGSTNGAGYFYCSSLAEYEMVKNTELLARVKDILETVKIMDKSAKETFGDAFQKQLF